uniref:Uncharacterized protein n=1 Tax=Poecilia mexicana TaxID=48701 RepID=A0A3B3XAE1_9TELE
TTVLAKLIAAIANLPPSSAIWADSYLSRWTASSVAVRPRVRVERPCVLLGRLHHAFAHRQVGRSDVGPRQRPLVPRRRGAAVARHIAGLGPVVAVTKNSLKMFTLLKTLVLFNVRPKEKKIF